MLAEQITLGFSEFLFCGFLALFILPQVVCRIFYFIPRIIYFVGQKKIDKKSFVQPLREMLIWVIIIVGAYIVAFLIKPSVGWMLLNSPTAVLCWILGAIQIILILATPRRREWQKSFYHDIYMKYATQQELDKYDQFLEMVEMLTPDEAAEALKEKKLTYLEKEALRARARAGTNSRVAKLRATK